LEVKSCNQSYPVLSCVLLDKLFSVSDSLLKYFYLLFSLVSGFVKKFIKARKNDDGLLKVRYILSDECKWDHMT
jgi:hypothetical protein